MTERKKKRETKQNQTTQIQVEWVGITKETTEKHSVNSHGVKGIKEKQKTKEWSEIYALLSNRILWKRWCIL